MKASKIIEKLLQKQNLSADEMQQSIEAILTGEFTPSQIAGFLIALRSKGETVDEIVSTVNIMRKLVDKVEVSNENMIDLVGTGGDSSNTFNISTTASFVVAACGIKVAKHGNRSVSSKSGSADLLEKVGIKIDLSSQQVAKCVEEVDIGFMFAPNHHKGMRFATPTRKELGVRTIFNLVGPLSNPAFVKRHLIGVFSQDLIITAAEVLRELGSKQVVAVHSEEGMDEISISGKTFIAELKNDEISTRTITPEQFGFKRSTLASIQVSDPAESFKVIEQVLNNENGAARDVVCLNAGFAIYVSGVVDSVEEGIEKAKSTLSDGLALQKLNQFKTFSNSL